MRGERGVCGCEVIGYPGTSTCGQRDQFNEVKLGGPDVDGKLVSPREGGVADKGCVRTERPARPAGDVDAIPRAERGVVGKE